MKKVVSGLTLAILLVSPLVVSAQFEDLQGGGQPGPNLAPAWGAVQIMPTLERITNWLFALLLVVAAIFIIIAGYLFVMAMGDPDKTKTARSFVMWALIGVLVGFVAKGLIMLVDTIVMGE